MTYKPSTPASLPTLLALAKGAPPATIGSASLRGAPSIIADGICGWTIQTQAPGPSVGADDSGPYTTAHTANAPNSFAGFFETLTVGNGYSRIGWGCGLAVRCNVNMAADGRYFAGFTGGRIGADLMASGDMYVGYNYAGVGFDIAYGHANWQFCSYGANAAHQYVDTGRAIIPGAPIIIVVDCADKATVTAELRHGVTGALLASHTFPAGDAPGVSESLQEGVACCTPNASPAFAHVAGLYGAFLWRRV